ICVGKNIKLQSGKIVDLHFVPEQIEVPILVEMGDRDTEAPPKDCIPVFDTLKSAGAPVDYRLYPATHGWDIRETRNARFRKPGGEGQTIVYEYDAAITKQAAKDAFAFLDAHLKKK